RRNNGIYRSACKAHTNVAGTAASSLSDDRWRELRQQMLDFVWSDYDGIRGGDFRVDPSREEKTCPRCDFQNVCRYDRYRVQLKRRARPALAVAQVQGVV